MMAVGVLEDLRGRAEEPGINLREDGFNRWLGALRLNPQQVYSLYSLSSQPPAAASATIASNKVGQHAQKAPCAPGDPENLSTANLGSRSEGNVGVGARRGWVVESTALRATEELISFVDTGAGRPTCFRLVQLLLR